VKVAAYCPIQGRTYWLDFLQASRQPGKPGRRPRRLSVAFATGFNELDGAVALPALDKRGSDSGILA